MTTTRALEKRNASREIEQQLKEMDKMIRVYNSSFELGRVVATIGVQHKFPIPFVEASLGRRIRKDWGVCWSLGRQT